MANSHPLQKAFTLLILLIIGELAFGQSKLPVDTAKLKQTGKKYLNTLEGETEKFKGPLGTLTGKFSALTDSTNRKVAINARLLTEANYITNSYVPAGGNGVYYKAGLEGTITLGKLPFTAGVTFNFKDKQVIWNYTQFSFSFDSRKYLDELKSTYLNYMGDMKNYYPDELATQVQGYKDSLTRLQNLQSTLTDKNYYKTLQNLSAQAKALQDTIAKSKADSSDYREYLRVCDSVKYYKTATDSMAGNVGTAMQDSLAKWEQLKTKFSGKGWEQSLQNTGTLNQVADPLLSNTLDSTQYKRYQQISDSIKRYKSIASQFADLEKYRLQNQDLQKKLDEYEGYLDKIKNTDNILNQPELKAQLSKTGILTKAGSIMGKVQKMGVGRVTLNLSDFTVRNQAIYGFNFDYLFNKWIYTGVGLGLMSPNNFQFNNFFSSQQWSSGFSRPKFIGYLRLGVGQLNEDHFHFIYTSYGEKFGPATTTYVYPGMPQANSVLAFVFKKSIAKTFSFDGELATSNSSFIKRTATFAPFETKKGAGFNFAAKAMVTGQIKKTGTNLSARLNMVSDKFISAGNMFARRNYLESNFTVTQQILQGKLSLQQMVNYNVTGLFQSANKFSTIQSTNILTASPVKPARYSISYTVVKQFGTTMSQTELHSTSLQQQYSHGKKNVNAVTAITTTYMHMKSGNTENRISSHQIQGSVQQTFTFTKGIRFMVSGGVNYMRSQLFPVQLGYWAETGNSFTVKQVSLSYSIRYLKDNLGLDNVFANASIHGSLCKGLQANLQAQAQVVVNNPYRVNLNIGAGLSYTFQYSFLLSKKSRKIHLANDFDNR
jgi:hypothetical protein